MNKIVQFFGDARYTRRRWQLFIGALVLTVLADLLVAFIATPHGAQDHAEFFWQQLPAWSAPFGFISCLLIVFVSKFLGHRGGLMREEDYYDD